MTRLRRLLRALASLTALAVLLIAVPVALARYGNWPITALPDRDWWDELSDSAMSDRTVFAALTVAAWAVWALFGLSVITEVVAGLRGVQAPQLALAGPLQRAARVLVVTVLLGLSIHHQAANAANRVARSPTPPARLVAAVVVAEAPSPRPQPHPPATPSPAPLPDDHRETSHRGVVGVDAVTGEAVVLIAHGDSPWALAETHLGDGARWRELWEHNRATTQPDGNTWDDPETIWPNWLIRIPDLPTTPPSAISDLTAPAAVERTAAPSTAETTELIHVVEAGDTLWDLAGRYLDDPTRFAELFDANQTRVQPDGRQLTDPDLIVPGWQLIIPGATPPTPTPPPPAPAEPDPVPAASPPATTAPATTTPPPTATAPTATRPPATTAAVQPDRAGGVDIAAVAGIAGAVVVSSAIASRIVWLRRRRGTRSARHTHHPASDIERAAIAAGDVPLVRWAGQHLARLVRGLDRRTITAGPVAVELSDHAGIEVLWDQPQHAATPAPWTSADGGWAWRLAYDPDAPVPPDELPAGIPALVTIGHRQGRQLLVDLEAFGVLTVTGPDHLVDGFLRSVAVELAAGDDLSDAYVTTANVDTAIHNNLDRLGTAELADAVGHATGVIASNRAVLDHAGVADTFAARAGDTTPIEATILVANPAAADDITTIADVFQPRCGAAAVLATDPVNHTAHLHLDDDGTAHLEPLGLHFQPVGLPADTMGQLHDTLDDLTELPDLTDADGLAPAPHHAADETVAASEPATADDVQHRLFEPATPAVNGHAGNGDHPDHPPRNPPAGNSADPNPNTNSDAHDDGDGFVDGATPDLAEPDDRLIVHVLGVPSVPGRPGLRRREIILAALLACRGGTLAASAAQDAIWGGKPVEAKTVWNFFGKTRSSLGSFDDDCPVMPSSIRDQGTLQLDARVTTDLAVLIDRLEQARQAPSSEAIRLLHDGLDLVDGPPFDGAGYDWAHRDQDVAYASTAIEQAADLLVQLALEADRADLARTAVTQALRGLPGNEDLYRLRMRVEHHAGNHAGVAAALDELRVYLADFDAEPSPATTTLFHELTRRTHA